MALQGTIKDFALPDIFQLIGIQRKTGILTLDTEQESVTIKFLDGQVVGADTRTETIEDRLGQVLVRTGRITQAQLDEALEIQRNTLQRLGHILVSSGRISQEELVEALKVQSCQIIYRLFRWREGSYSFDKVENLDYDQSHFVPISSETILMEGARMIDEWPIIERRIRSDRMVLRKTEAGEALEPAVESILVDDIDFNLGDSDGISQETDASAGDVDQNAITLSAEEREILSLVDGQRTVREICDLLTLGEFDTFRILSEMITRHLVEADRSRSTSQTQGRGRWLSGLMFWATQLVLALAVLGALFTLPTNPLSPWMLLGRAPATEQLRLYTSMARLEKLEKAVRVFYLDLGRFPESTDALARQGYVEEADLVDSWGRPYRLQLSAGGYQLFGVDSARMPRPELTVSRRFNPVQRLMVAGGPAAPQR